MWNRLQGVETAYKAQLRRKDAEYERLRKNLQDSVVRATKEKRVRSLIPFPYCAMSLVV